MTANQIAYHNMKEQIRSNQAKETENYRHNVATESQAKAELSEKHRAAIANEMFNVASLEEKSRDNRVKNAIATAANTETHRANKAKENIQVANLHELIRDHKAVLSERASNNINTLKLKQWQTQLSNNQFKQEQAIRKYLALTGVEQNNARLVADLMNAISRGALDMAKIGDLLWPLTDD